MSLRASPSPLPSCWIVIVFASLMGCRALRDEVSIRRKGAYPNEPTVIRVIPLTTARLRAIAQANGVGSGSSGVAFNYAVGIAFEHWILDSLGFVPRNKRPF